MASALLIPAPLTSPLCLPGSQSGYQAQKHWHILTPDTNTPRESPHPSWQCGTELAGYMPHPQAPGTAHGLSPRRAAPIHSLHTYSRMHGVVLVLGHSARACHPAHVTTNANAHMCSGTRMLRHVAVTGLLSCSWLHCPAPLHASTAPVLCWDRFWPRGRV